MSEKSNPEIEPRTVEPQPAEPQPARPEPSDQQEQMEDFITRQILEKDTVFFEG